MSNGNSPAFPFVCEESIPYCGLTKRELFTAIAFHALMSNDINRRYHELETVSKTAIKYADILLKELESGQDDQP
jgi:hypothetical protein